MKWRDFAVLIFFLVFLVWELLYLAVGDVALRSPVATAKNLEALLADARFLPHVRETGLAFAQGFAIVAFGAIHGIVPISIFALNAVRNINPTQLRTARVLRLSPMGLFLHVLLPATLPEIVSGIRVGFSLALIGTLLGEMFGSQHGPGHLLMQAMSLHNIERILALTLLIVVFAAGINALLLALDRRLHARA